MEKIICYLRHPCSSGAKAKLLNNKLNHFSDHVGIAFFLQRISLVFTHPKRVSFRLSLAMYTAMSTARAIATATAMTTYHQCQDNAGGEERPERKR